MEGTKYAAVLPEPRKVSAMLLVSYKKKITSLSHSDDVPSLQDSWDGVGLHWCRILVTTKVDIVDHNWVKARSMKLRWSVSVIEGIEVNLR
jgi:hypothetical protein